MQQGMFYAVQMEASLEEVMGAVRIFSGSEKMRESFGKTREGIFESRVFSLQVC
jgi:hypothetical protein